MKLHYDRQGTGRPLVIVHGLFGSADNWRTVAGKLAQQADVISLDLRNHGHSPHSPQMSYPLMAQDIVALMQDLALSQADFIGHSIGGKVVMALSERYPQYIRKMVIVDMAPKACPPQHTTIFEALMALDLTQYQRRRELDTALAKTIADQAVRQFLLMNVDSQQNQLRWRINLPALQKNYPQLLEAVCRHQVIDVPCCFIRGGRSSYITDDDIKEIRRIFPRSEVVTIGRAGHWVHVDVPDAFLDSVSRCLGHD